MVDPMPESIPPPEDWVAGGAAGRVAGAVVVDAWRRCAGLATGLRPPPRLERWAMKDEKKKIRRFIWC